MKTRKRMVCGMLLLAVLVTGVIGSFCATRFSDVPSNHWAATYINAAADEGIVVGYGNGKFGPSDPITVAEMATIVARVSGYDEKGSGYWAQNYLEYCKKNGCLPDKGEINAQNYGVPCTREEAAYMFYHGIGSNNPSIANYDIEKEDIPDFNQVTSGYSNSVLMLYKKGVLVGMDEKMTFGPKETFTRAQIATMLYRAGICGPYKDAFKPSKDNPPDDGKNYIWDEDVHDWISIGNGGGTITENHELGSEASEQIGC